MPVSEMLPWWQLGVAFLGVLTAAAIPVIGTFIALRLDLARSEARVEARLDALVAMIEGHIQDDAQRFQRLDEARVRQDQHNERMAERVARLEAARGAR